MNNVNLTILSDFLANCHDLHDRLKYYEKVVGTETNSLEITLDEYYNGSKIITDRVGYYLGILEIVKLIRQESSPNAYPNLQNLINRYQNCKENRKNA